MRPRKIIGLLIPLLQLILVLKLIELVRGQSSSPIVQYITSIPYNSNKNTNSRPNIINSAGVQSPLLPTSSIKPTYYDHRGRSFPRYEPSHKKKRRLRPFWTTISTTTEEPSTTIVVEEIIEYADNGTEISRNNITKVLPIMVKKDPKLVPLCPDHNNNSTKCKYDLSFYNLNKNKSLLPNHNALQSYIDGSDPDTLTSMISFILLHYLPTSTIFNGGRQMLQEATSSRQLQNIRKSTIPLLILLLKFIAGFIAFETFLLLWKINYYTVNDPYALSGPIDNDPTPFQGRGTRSNSLDHIISNLLNYESS